MNYQALCDIKATTKLYNTNVTKCKVGKLYCMMLYSGLFFVKLWVTIAELGAGVIRRLWLYLTKVFSNDHLKD